MVVAGQPDPGMIFSRIDGAVAILSLDRGAARNAIRMTDWDRLADAVNAAGQQAGAILLTSAVPGIFCAGADLTEFPAMMADPALPTRFREAMARATAALADSAVPVIAVIEGGCFGAGVALAMACDLRVAGRQATFAVPPAKLGIAYPQGDIDRLRTLVGPGQAARLLLTGDRIDAGEAQRIGLVELPGDAAAAMVLARRIAANSRASVAALREGLRGRGEGDARFDALFGGPDLRERWARR